MSIARRYILYTFLLVFFLGCLFTPINFISSYKKEVARVSRQIIQIQYSHRPSLISSLWLTHYELLQKQIDNIVQFPYIDRVEVVDDEGKVFFAQTEDSTIRNEKKYYESLEKYQEQLTYDYKDREVPIGFLTLYINMNDLTSDVFAREIPYLLFQFLSAVIIAVTISFLFHRMVGKHLHQFSEFLKNDDYTTLISPFSLDRKRTFPDELYYLSQAVNTMRTKLHKHITEKDMLLKEVHHRIKNNMAAMESLLNLQASNTGNQAASEVIGNARNRLHSMGLLYEKLYKIGAVNEMPAADYLAPLLEEIIRVSSANKNIQVETHFDSSIFTAKILSTFGIILNELVTNSLKYAFPDERAGIIHVRCTVVSEDTAEFIYSDNGIGLPEQVVSGKQSGLGMMLIRSLAEQCNGTININGGMGTTIRLLFKYSNT